MRRFTQWNRRKTNPDMERSLLADDMDRSRMDRRVVHIMDHAANTGQCSNLVTTAKYSLIPFSFSFIVWKNMFEQFQKAANVYFLFISILQVIPGLSPTGRYTTLAPLIIVLLFTMLKDAWEDWKRRVQDRVVNNRAAKVFRGGQWGSVSWKDVLVGDIILCYKGEPFPADLVLLWSSEQDGLCFIETASLDGETNLKLRRCPELPYKTLLRQNFDSGAPLPTALGGSVVCELPNNRLYNFDGYLQMTENGKEHPRAALAADNVLLRGSELRNTKACIGVVVFTGSDSKLIRNMNAQHHKSSRVEKVTNRQIMYVFFLQLILAGVCSIGYSVQIQATSDHWYLASFTIDDSKASALSFLTFTILYNSLIPISLYIMLEMVKAIQGFLISSDADMYHVDTDTAAMVRNSKLNEELGQVEYVFSDKTGTLTCNMMEFRKFSCLGRASDGQLVVRTYGETVKNSKKMHKPSSPGPAQGYSGSTFVDKRITNGNWRTQENKDEIRLFLEAMAICHTVVPELDNGRLLYQASSPDEACLVRAAQTLGVALQTRTESEVVVETSTKERLRWDVLTTIEFTSARKRMSVVVRDPRGSLQLLVKGADNVVMGMLRRDPSTEELIAATEEQLTAYAAEGLRTLVFARTNLSEEVFKRWKRKYDAANTDIHDRHEKVDLVLQELERDLELIGTTAIEDKLQDGVPQTIELLSRAGIKVWVLTGDKQETAINIGYACNLLHGRMGLFTFDNCDASNITHALEKYIMDVEAASVEAGQDIGLIVQGSVLQHILPVKDDLTANEFQADLFVSLAIKCKAVICCRVSPIQKAQLVQAVKERVGTVTLAIGDGANDVSMIQMAHVGVGISGLEGLQAARASDYSIAQFRFLQRLLLVHGRWNYLRVSSLITFTFYKNMTLYMTQFLFAFYNLFTGQSLYDPWALAFYNLAFTSFPIMALAIFDKDVAAERLLAVDQFPELYQECILGTRFNTGRFFQYQATALFHSLLCFLLPTYTASGLVEPDTGRDLAMPGHAITAYTAILVVVTLKCGLETHGWTIANFVVVIASLYFWYLFLFFYCSLFWVIPSFQDFAFWYGADTITLGHTVSWLVVIVVTTVSLLRDFSFRFFKKHYKQDLVEVVQAYEVREEPFNRFDVKKALPWLFPKQELKEFKPSLSEGVGRHRFRSAAAPGTSGGGGGASTAGSPSPGSVHSGGGPLLVAPSPTYNSPERGFSPMAGESLSFAASFASGHEVSPGRRRMRITDIIGSAEYEYAPTMLKDPPGPDYDEPPPQWAD